MVSSWLQSGAHMNEPIFWSARVCHTSAFGSVCALEASIATRSCITRLSTVRLTAPCFTMAGSRVRATRGTSDPDFSSLRIRKARSAFVLSEASRTTSSRMFESGWFFASDRDISEISVRRRRASIVGLRRRRLVDPPIERVGEGRCRPLDDLELILGRDFDARRNVAPVNEIAVVQLPPW